MRTDEELRKALEGPDFVQDGHATWITANHRPADSILLEVMLDIRKLLLEVERRVRVSVL